MNWQTILTLDNGFRWLAHLMIAISLLSLFLGIIISMRRNQSLQAKEVRYFDTHEQSIPISRGVEAPVPRALALTAHARDDGHDPNELRVFKMIGGLLPDHLVMLPYQGLDTVVRDVAVKKDATVDAVICNLRTGRLMAFVVFTDGERAGDELDAVFVETGRPVLHVAAKQPWDRARMSYLLREGLGIDELLAA
jgi:hypothetical protein